MKAFKKVLYIKTVTPTHPGAGPSVGAVDLPLQREVHTDLPFIAGSSLKGALRSWVDGKIFTKAKDSSLQILDNIKPDGLTDSSEGLRKLQRAIEKIKSSSRVYFYMYRSLLDLIERVAKPDKKDDAKTPLKKWIKDVSEELNKVFGDWVKGGESPSAGSLILTDAHLLLYPARSLLGLWVYVTSPGVLKRFAELVDDKDLLEEIGDIEGKLLDSSGGDPDGKAVPLWEFKRDKYAHNNHIYLEELPLKLKDKVPGERLKGYLQDVGLANNGLFNKTLVVSDNVLRYVTKFGALILYRNRISPETGTVESGALWSEEHLPPETVMFALVGDDGVNVEDNKTAADWLAEELRDGSVFHLGGDRTVGKGFVKIFWKELNNA